MKQTRCRGDVMQDATEIEHRQRTLIAADHVDFPTLRFVPFDRISAIRLLWKNDRNDKSDVIACGLQILKSISAGGSIKLCRKA